jgi:hypothetical protein
MNEYGVFIHYIDRGYGCARRKTSQFYSVQKVLMITFRPKREEVYSEEFSISTLQQLLLLLLLLV